MVYNTQNYWVFGLFPSSNVLGTRKHDLSETGSVSVLRCGGRKTSTLLGPLDRANLNHWTNSVSKTTAVYTPVLLSIDTEFGCAVAQASASHRGGPGLWWTKRHWGRFSPSTSVSPANHSTDFSIIIITRGWHNRPLVAAVSNAP
jgi:hypothetical protein